MIINKLTEILQDKKKTNFLIYGFGQVFNLLSPLLITPKIVLVCGEAGFGKIGLAFALSLFLILIVDYSFDIKGIKEVSENRNTPIKLQEILITTVFTKIILFFATFFVAIILIFCLNFFNEEKSLFLLTLTIVFAQIFNPVWYLQGIEDFKLISIITICSKSLYVLTVFIFVSKSSDYILVNFFLGISSLIFNIVGLILIKKKFKFTIVLPKFSVVKRILINDFSFCLSQLFLSVRQLSPLVLTSLFLGYAAAGQYKIIEQTISLCRTFIQVFLKFFYPSACFKFKIKNKLGIQYWKKYTIACVVMISFFLLAILLFSDSILRFFQLSENAILKLGVLFKISLIISFLMSISLPLEQLMFIKEKHSKYIKTTIFVTVINVSLIIFFINKFQLNAVIFSIIFSEILFIIFYYKFARLRLNIKTQLIKT